MRRLLYLVTGAFLLHCVLSCSQEREYLPVIHESSNYLVKRGFTIKQRVLQVWPNGQIMYCFDTANNGLARKKLKSIIPKAWEIWTVRGTNRFLKMEEGSKKDCTAANRDRYLLISYNEDGLLLTTPGLDIPIGKDGPSMTLDISEGIGSGSAVSNVAHEIGHAWGLLHEHQRPSLWTSYYGGNAQFNTFSFMCENMADYAQKLAERGNMNRECRYEAAAQAVSFSAYNILPYLNGYDAGSAGQVDWESIMIYGSIAGSKTVNGQRTNTLTKADGSTFGYNLFPSQTDIDTLNTLYANELGDQKMGKRAMFWSKASPFHGLFNKDNKGSSCS